MTRALFIIDPPERLDPPTDTTLALMQASYARGHRVDYCTLSDLQGGTDPPRARARPVRFAAGEEMFRTGEPGDLDLSEISVLYMRKDPPVDLAYLAACALLDRLPGNVLQVNPARALRLHGEKMIPLYFPGLMPETVVTASATLLADFLDRQKKIVLKPLEDCGGRGILLLERDEREALARLRQATGNGTRFVQAQRFLPESAEGDKRVLLLGGEILGWVRRVPAPGEFRSNVNVGGRCVPCDLSGTDRDLCERLKPWLTKEGIHFAGVDLVGPYLLEVNITSPSCLREINELGGVALEERILDYVNARCH